MWKGSWNTHGQATAGMDRFQMAQYNRLVDNKAKYSDPNAIKQEAAAALNTGNYGPHAEKFLEEQLRTGVRPDNLQVMQAFAASEARKQAAIADGTAVGLGNRSPLLQGGGGGGGGGGGSGQLARFTGGTTGVLPDFQPYQDYLSGNLSLTQPPAPRGAAIKNAKAKNKLAQRAMQKAEQSQPAAGVPTGDSPITGRSYTSLLDDKGNVLSMRQTGTYGTNSPFDVLERDRMQMLSKDIAETTDPNKKLAMQMFGARQLGQSVNLSNPSNPREGSYSNMTRRERIALARSGGGLAPYELTEQNPNVTGQYMTSPSGQYRTFALQRSPYGTVSSANNESYLRPWYLNV